jgi:hypothetical protein
MLAASALAMERPRASAGKGSSLRGSLGDRALIRISASLVAIAVVLLIAGLVTSDLKLVYAAIGVSGVALLALFVGATSKREELFGTDSQSPAQPQDSWPPFGREREAAASAPVVAAAPASVSSGTGPGWRDAERPAEPWNASGAPSGSTWPAAPGAGTPVTTVTPAPAANTAPAASAAQVASEAGPADGGWSGPWGEDRWDVSPVAEPWDVPQPSGYASPWEPGSDTAIQPVGEEAPAAGGSHGDEVTADGTTAMSLLVTEETIGTGESAGDIDLGEPEVEAEIDEAAESSEIAAGEASGSVEDSGSVGESGSDAPADVAEAPAGDAGPALDAEPVTDTVAADSSPNDEAEVTGTEADDASAQEPDLTREVTVVPGVPRYHDAQCILIRFMGDGDLERMPLAAAQELGCTPCRACLPE